MDNLLNLSSYPRAILHIDCDAFFASVEQAVHPEYKGKPVITGKERGIVAAASYEAKAKGVSRGVRLWEVKKLCPDAIILPSDYETYSLYSKRMFQILRRFTPTVEEYSIDEAFLEITGFRRTYHSSYEQIALKIKQTVESELGITVSLGLSLSKVLAKIGSKFKKPAGFTPIPGYKIREYLLQTPIEKIWGIGHNTGAYCNTLNIKTAYDFAGKNEDFIKTHFSKPYYEIWQELNGNAVYQINTENKTDYASISKTKTFTPASNNKNYVYSQLLKNLENACIKARRHKLLAKGLICFLKTQDFKTNGMEVKLNRASAFPSDMIEIVRKIFESIFKSAQFYRATGIILIGLESDAGIQLSLFEPPIKVEKMTNIYNVIDKISEKMGKHTLYMGSTMLAHTKNQHVYQRGDIPQRKMHRLKGETVRKHLAVPFLMGGVD